MDVLGIPVSTLTPSALLGVAILMVMTGKLWPNSAYQEIKTERNYWRQAWEKEREARITSDTQTAELLEVSKTTYAFVQAVFRNSERIRQSGEPDAHKET